MHDYSKPDTGHAHPHAHNNGEPHIHDHPHPHTHGHGGMHHHVHSQEEKRAVMNRLARAIGHLESVKRMIERDEETAAMS